MCTPCSSPGVLDIIGNLTAGDSIFVVAFATDLFGFGAPIEGTFVCAGNACDPAGTLDLNVRTPSDPDIVVHIPLCNVRGIGTGDPFGFRVPGIEG